MAARGRSTRAAEGRSDKLGVAICGLGGFTSNSIAPELASARNVYLAGVVTGDPDGKARKGAAKHGFPEKNVFSYETMDRLASAGDIQIVHVATPNRLHAEHTIAAAHAGKHVMCEKPMSTIGSQCKAMVAATESAGIPLGIDYRRRFEPHHVGAIQAICDGKVGAPIHGNYEFSWGYANTLADPKRQNQIKQWLLDPVMAGGGGMFDTGVYPIQAACYLTGSTPTAVPGLPTTRHRTSSPRASKRR